MSIDTSQSILLVTTTLGLATAYYQYRTAKTQAQGFRQQLLPVLHHAEGIASALQAIGGLNDYSSVQDIKNAVNALQWDASALFFGLVETKIGGVSISQDIDNKYQYWASLELERKMIPLKDWLNRHSEEQKTIITTPKTDIRDQL